MKTKKDSHLKLTDWHRLFGMTLTDFFTGTRYAVELEKDLSLKKQLLDVVIIEKKDGNPPESLPDGFESLKKHNLLSYKSMRESFTDWTADELIGHFVNYRKQISPSLKKLLPKEDFRLYAVCTKYPAKLAKEVPLKALKAGVYDLRWGIRDIRVIVSSQTEKEERNAVWLMFSAVAESVHYGFSRYRGKLDEMSIAIRDLFTNYQTEGIIAMPYTIEDYRREIKERALKMMTPDDVIRAFPAEEIFKRFSPEEIFKRFSPEERLRGLSAEDVFRKFSADEIEAYLKRMRKAKKKPKE
ncbi:MAG: hypothetical protein AB7S75_06115 [Desulfococcaceae bacterium]